ncbi:MAG: SAM-dependent methyltransferase [Myxococcales bacterium]|nr:SAM-dependent methyltransferase [Myxococcales bacterium]
MSGLVRVARRPDGWMAPGPRPAGFDACGGPREHEDLCFLSGDWRIFQRVDGHRWSLDDLVTAWVAVSAGPEPEAHLDLGCGIGSVLMMVAWAYPAAEGVGVEAQVLSAGLARRSLAYNGATGRVSVVEGDFRAVAPARVGGWPLITGTPPYFAVGAAVESRAVQKGPCRVEHRGGVEDYLRAGSALLADDGRFVFCAAHGQTARVESEAASLGFELARLDVVPKAGKAPLISVFTAQRRSVSEWARSGVLEVRDVEGQWTGAFREVRARLGMPAG